MQSSASCCFLTAYVSLTLQWSRHKWEFFFLLLLLDVFIKTRSIEKSSLCDVIKWHWYLIDTTPRLVTTRPARCRPILVINHSTIKNTFPVMLIVTLCLWFDNYIWPWMTYDGPQTWKSSQEFLTLDNLWHSNLRQRRTWEASFKEQSIGRKGSSFISLIRMTCSFLLIPENRPVKARNGGTVHFTSPGHVWKESSLRFPSFSWGSNSSDPVKVPLQAWLLSHSYLRVIQGQSRRTHPGKLERVHSLRWHTHSADTLPSAVQPRLNETQ